MRIFHILKYLIIIGIIIFIFSKLGYGPTSDVSTIQTILSSLFGGSTSTDSERTRTMTDEVKKFTSECTPTKGVIARDAVGLSIVGIDDPDLLVAIADLDVPWVRVEFPWSVIARDSNGYQWDAYDRFASGLEKNNTQALAVLHYFPERIGTKNINWNVAANDYAQFVKNAVKRYKAGGDASKQFSWQQGYGIRYWEIFNEPNLPGYGWLTNKAKPGENIENYALMLARANIALRTEDPNAVIVLGGLSPDGYPYRDFLGRLYELGAGKCFDIVAFHPYGRIGKFKEVAQDLREGMIPYGDGNKPIWFNEIGTDNQKDVESTLTTAFNERAAVDGIFWFTLKNFKKIGDDFGLITYTGERRESYQTFKSLLMTLP